jgi:hypothetical protein
MANAAPLAGLNAQSNGTLPYRHRVQTNLSRRNPLKKHLDNPTCIDIPKFVVLIFPEYSPKLDGKLPQPHHFWKMMKSLIEF